MFTNAGSMLASRKMYYSSEKRPTSYCNVLKVPKLHILQFKMINCSQSMLDQIKKGAGSAPVLFLTVVMVDPGPSAATLNEQSFALGFGCSLEDRFLRPSDWVVSVRHWVMAAH